MDAQVILDMIASGGVTGLLAIVVAYQTAQVRAMTKELKEDKETLLRIVERYTAMSESIKNTLERVLERFR
jgi:hypothetical protein